MTQQCRQFSEAHKAPWHQNVCVCMSTREWEQHTQAQQTPLHTLQRITVVQGHVGYWDRGEGIPVIQRN